jgi:hypothetical protein
MNAPLQPRRGRETVILVALMTLCAGSFFLFLLFITGYLALAFLGVVAFLALFAGLHYLLWGRSLATQVPRQPRQHWREWPRR